MITRVRIEAEGRTTAEVEECLYAAHEALTQDTADGLMSKMFSSEGGYSKPYAGLADAQAGEMVIERVALDTGGEAGHGAIFFRGRMITHYAKPQKALDLRERTADPPLYAPDLVQGGRGRSASL